MTAKDELLAAQDKLVEMKRCYYSGELYQGTIKLSYEMIEAQSMIVAVKQRISLAQAGGTVKKITKNEIRSKMR